MASIEFGKCEKCGANNPKVKALTECRQCQARLPWARAPKTQVLKAQPARSAGGPAVKSSFAANVDWGFWCVAAISFLVPCIGFCLYLSFSNSGDEKAGAAGMGAAFGFGLGVLSVVLRTMAAGS